MPLPTPPAWASRAFRVRRSELTCPGHSLRMMAKAAATSADEVILDLEDACAVSQKVEARGHVIEALKTLDFTGKLRAFRTNAVQSPWFYRDIVDVVEQAGAQLDVVVLPKVDSADDVKFADRLLSQVEAAAGLPVGRIRFEVLIESARALLGAEEISHASPRLSALIFGIADYAGDVGARDILDDTFSLFHYPKSHLLAVARAAGLDAIDCVTIQFRDLERVRREAEAAARMGFDGKWAVHPAHLEPIHMAFTPTRAELERAVRIIRTYADADAREGRGVVVIGDEMIDAAGLRLEWRKVAVGRQAGLLDEEGHWLMAEGG